MVSRHLKSAVIILLASLGLLASSSHARNSDTALKHEQILRAFRIRAYRTQHLNVPEDLPQEMHIEVEARGRINSLAVRKVSFLGEGFRIRLYAGGTYHEIDPGPVRTYCGTLANDPNAMVAAVLTEDGLSASIFDSHDGNWSIRPVASLKGISAARSEHIVYMSDDEEPEQGYCGLWDVNDPGHRHHIEQQDEAFAPAEQPGDPESALGEPLSETPKDAKAATDCTYKLVDLVVDADNYFYRSYDNDVNKVRNRVYNLVNNVNLYYGRDAMIQYQLNDLVIRETRYYQYCIDNGPPNLGQMRNKWQNDPASTAKRDIVHILTTRANGNVIGTAYVNTICSSYKYGWTKDSARVMAHEIGHNWSLGHCNGSNCGNSIMCGGGTAFCEADAKILKNKNFGCVGTTNEVSYAANVRPMALPNTYTYTVSQLYSGQSKTLNVCRNDHDGNCDDFYISSVESPTARDAAVTISAGTSSEGLDQLIYTPPPVPFDGDDIFSYTIKDNSGSKDSTDVTVQVTDAGITDARPPDNSVVIRRDPLLRWSGHEDMLSYDIYFGGSRSSVANATTDSAQYRGNVTTESFEAGTVKPDDRYFWRIDPVWDGSLVGKGSVNSFYTRVTDAQLEHGLQVHWSFDSMRSPYAVDSSGSGNDGVFLNGPIRTHAGIVNGAVELDGIDDKVELDSFGGPLDKFTVSVWARAAVTGQDENCGVFSNSLSNGDDDFQIDLDGTNPGNYRYKGDKNADFGPVTTDWTHLALTSNGSSTTLYRNGAKVTTVSSEAMGVFSGLRVGANRGNAKMFEGTIDEFRVYDRVLTAAEIGALYNQGSEGMLLCHWKFDETQGTTARDASGSGNDGVLLNGPVWTSDGAIGRALSFDGRDDNVELNPFDGPLEEFAVAVWAKAAVTGQRQYAGVFCNSMSNVAEDFQIDIDGTDPGNYRYRGDDAMILGPVRTYWTHLAITCDGRNTYAYYNGAPAGQVAEVMGLFEAIRVGVNRGGTNEFNGTIDDVRIYGRFLRGETIELLYFGALPSDFDYSTKVDSLDLATLANAWQSTPADGHWNSDCDLDKSQVIALGDLAILGMEWMKKIE